jgi:hypothetical protein
VRLPWFRGMRYWLRYRRWTAQVAGDGRRTKKWSFFLGAYRIFFFSCVRVKQAPSLHPKPEAIHSCTATKTKKANRPDEIFDVDVARVDLLLKFILAVAGQEERGERELGPIHLLKYAYLGDLAYSETHSGETFTRTAWRFYNFGPWAEELFARIEPVALNLGAEVRTFSRAGVENDSVRYSFEDEEELERLDHLVPTEVGRAVRTFIRRFHADTSALLHHVYSTAPMLRAAPGESLHFTIQREEPEHSAESEGDLNAEPERDLSRAPVSKTARRKKLEALKNRVRDKMTSKPAESKPLAPRYDEVFAEGVKWLDGLAGSDLDAELGEMIFSNDIWKSRGRREPGVP